MIKILYNWDLEDKTKTIEECLKKKIIKYYHSETKANFIILEKNLKEVKEVLKDEYKEFQEYDLLEWIKEVVLIDSYELKVENIFGNSFVLNSDTVWELLSDEKDAYITDKDELNIYNSECPSNELWNKINELGRQQAKLQMESLLMDLKYAKFQ